MKRRQLVLTLGAAALAPPGLAQTAKPARVGWIANVSREGALSPLFLPQRDAFLSGLREAGLSEGRDFVIEWRYAEGKPELIEKAAAELVAMKVDAIFANGGLPITTARRATGSIPIVGESMSIDPVAQGWAASLARPGGNFTGVFLDTPELMGKHLDLLRETVPGLARVGVFGDPAINSAQTQAAADAAKRLRMELKETELRVDTDLEAAFAAASRARAQALLLFPAPRMVYDSRRIAELTLKHGLPAVSVFAQLAKAGVLMSYGPSLAEMWRRGGALVAKVLKGEKPGTLPIERPHRFEFIVNARTAKALGLRLPQSILIQATEVIE